MVVAKYPDGGVVMDEHVTPETVAELSAALAASQQREAEVLAWGEAMREALEAIHANYEDTRLSHEGYRAKAAVVASAALSTRAPAALEEMRERVRSEALEEAAKHIVDKDHDPKHGTDPAIRWAAAAIRAMKREGEG